MQSEGANTSSRGRPHGSGSWAGARKVCRSLTGRDGLGSSLGSYRGRGMTARQRHVVGKCDASRRWWIVQVSGVDVRVSERQLWAQQGLSKKGRADRSMVWDADAAGSPTTLGVTRVCSNLQIWNFLIVDSWQSSGHQFGRLLVYPHIIWSKQPVAFNIL